GLGLSIVKAICAAHGAEIKVTSTEGKGSSFRVELGLANGQPTIVNHPDQSRVSLVQGPRTNARQ
ncbi:MAG: ATP-binding protein, partial [Candidatus Acidiferrales bacterium]